MALFTQGQKIEVIVRKEDTSAATAGANDTSAEETTSGTSAGASGAGTYAGSYAASGKVNKRIIGTKVLSAGIASTRLGINYYFGGVGYRNGDAAQQEAVQRNVELIEEGAGILLSIGIGATYGVRGGPIGMVVGALAATATTATSLAVKYLNKEREYNIKVFKEENAIEYRRARANLSLTTGRLR